jgi:steroid delta-isomerase-like uncharacterized protein
MEGDTEISDAENEQRAHQWHLEMVQEGKIDLADEVLTPDVTVHVVGQDFHGIDQAKQVAQAFKTAFPDVTITHHEVLVQGDRGVIRWSATGTHGGDYFGTPASGNTVSFSGIDWFHFQDGKLSEIWIDYDNAGVTRQMAAAAGTSS